MHAPEAAHKPECVALRTNGTDPIATSNSSEESGLLMFRLPMNWKRFAVIYAPDTGGG